MKRNCDDWTMVVVKYHRAFYMNLHDAKYIQVAPSIFVYFDYQDVELKFLNLRSVFMTFRVIINGPG